MSEDDDKKLPAIQNRLIGTAVEIDQDDPLGIVYQQHSHQKPKNGFQEGTRTVGNYGNGQWQPIQKKPAGRRGKASIFDAPLDLSTAPPALGEATPRS